MLLKAETSLLRDEQVCAFDNILEVALALFVVQTVDIGDVDGFGATSAGYK
jgi:hypothetical protein